MMHDFPLSAIFRSPLRQKYFCGHQLHLLVFTRAQRRADRGEEGDAL